jgi:class 3 adenylate cyclase
MAYAQSGETQVAYRVIGDPGRVDVVVVAGSVFPLELLAEDRVAARFLDGLGALGRLVVFDKRGVGLVFRDRAVAEHVRHHGGRAVKYTGDRVLALMPSATAALETTRSVREHLARLGLRIRVGIHVGDIDVRGDDVSGVPLGSG